MNSRASDPQTGWKEFLSRYLSKGEDQIDRLKYALVERLWHHDPVMIMPYCGFGTQQQVIIRGRVLEDEGLSPATDNDTFFDNLLAAYARFESDEIPDVEVVGSFQGTERKTRTGKEGFFELEIPVNEVLPESRQWHDLDLWLTEEVRSQTGIHATGRVYIPHPSADYGIISDIDDTIIKTYATDLIQVARLNFLGNARTRTPFEGVAEFYRALQRGTEDSRQNPMFYVSSGPWNLFDLIIDFMRINDIPVGPLMLQDFGIEPGKLIHGPHVEHKVKQISVLLKTYPDLPFILIGDSGQQDPEVYHEVVRQFPGRILAIYIRDVALERKARVTELAEGMKGHGVEMVLVPDSNAAAAHALEKGYIVSDDMAEIASRTASDKSLPTE